MRRSFYAGVILICVGAAIFAVLVGHSKSPTNHANTASAKMVTYPMGVTMETNEAFLAAEKAWRRLPASEKQAEVRQALRAMSHCTMSGAVMKCPVRITAAKH
jgi:hypothetical protein